jgi:2-amino-4-hydroxy-6-hydroxymethyldihydropteridine diphosphokinase / dihydropteroate synthase
MKAFRLALTSAGRYSRPGYAGTISSINGSSIAFKNMALWPLSDSPGNISRSHPRNSENQTKRKAYIAFGSNLGDRIGMIERACNEMSKRGIQVLRTSSLWETEPMYVLDQNSFINGACEVGLVSFV